MNSRISLMAFGHATSLLLAISFTLCVLWDLWLPQHTMFTAWRDLLPGFEWLSWPGFFLGLIESWAYGWYAALIWVPLYNLFAARRTA